MQVLTAYIGRDNEEALQLLQDGALVAEYAVTRAVFKFGTYCLDTAVDTDIFYFDDNHQILYLKLGLINDIVAGIHRDGQLTLFDSSTTIGYAWDSFIVSVQNWPVCGA